MVAIIAAAAQTSVNRIVTIFNIGLCEWRYSHRKVSTVPPIFRAPALTVRHGVSSNAIHAAEHKWIKLAVMDCVLLSSNFFFFP
jgi:hypothetical protein